MAEAVQQVTAEEVKEASEDCPQRREKEFPMRQKHDGQKQKRPVAADCNER